MPIHCLGMEEYRFYREKLSACKKNWEIQALRHLVVRDKDADHLKFQARKNIPLSAEEISAPWHACQPCGVFPLRRSLFCDTFLFILRNFS